MYVSEILKKVETHDQPILDLLMVDRNEMTMIQLSNYFKRPRSDMKMTLERLKLGGHIKQSAYYGKWFAVNYDFTEEVISKRPNEAADKMKKLQSENEELREVIKSAMRVKDLWLPTHIVSNEHEGEAIALHLMYRKFESVLNKTENTSND